MGAQRERPNQIKSAFKISWRFVAKAKREIPWHPGSRSASEGGGFEELRAMVHSNLGENVDADRDQARSAVWWTRGKSTMI
jgi:hypothetical protein